jgi:predicted alpha/beta hydrolase
LHVLQFADDPWGTEAAVSLMTERYTGARERSIQHVTPAEAGVAKIGHFGFFRPEMRDTLWKPAADWLLSDAEAAAVARPRPAA